MSAGLAYAVSGADLQVGSNAYNAAGTVTATGPAAEVAKYELGFLQTVFQSTRNFKYSPLNHQKTIGERLLPSLLGRRHRFTDTTGILPVKDGDDYAGNKADKLWYEKNDVSSFANAGPDQQIATLYDQPDSSSEFKKMVSGVDQYLVRTNGLDSFRTWLAIRKKSWGSEEYRRLGYIDWRVNYKSTVTPNVHNPTAAVVVPEGNSGGEIVSKVKGVGGYLPVTGKGSANSAAEEKESRW